MQEFSLNCVNVNCDEAISVDSWKLDIYLDNNVYKSSKYYFHRQVPDEGWL